MKPNKIVYENYDGYVYNIEVENNHNYFANNILVSNCHEKATVKGEHADLNNPVIDTFLPYTEIAIGGGNPLSHPDLEHFLIHLKELKCIPSMTVNQVHFIEEFERLKEMRDKKLFYGLGVSVFNPDEDLAKKLLEFPNAVVHTIAGITTLPMLKKMKKLGIRKILMLGYKSFGRGEQYYNDNIRKNIEELQQNLKEIKTWFKILSFDNLAIKQLDVRNIMTDKEWEEFYMGDDGSYTMYLDLVNKQYAQSSTSIERFDLLPTINDMFLDIREKKEKGSSEV